MKQIETKNIFYPPSIPTILWVVPSRCGIGIKIHPLVAEKIENLNLLDDNSEN